MVNIQPTEYYEYVTKENDTFDLIAFEAYGDEFLANYIIDFNVRFADVILFSAGTVLKVPVIEQADLDESMPPWRQPGGGDNEANL